MSAVRVCCCVVFGLALGNFGFTAELYWDANGDASGFGDASGRWGMDAWWSGDAAGETTPLISESADADDLHFGSDTLGLGSGTITVEQTQQFNSITFGSASGLIKLSGGALELAAPQSVIYLNNASNEIASALSGTNGLWLYEAPQLVNTNFLTSTPTVIFPNAKLSDYGFMRGVLHGASIPRSYADSYHVLLESGALYAQFQVLHDVYVKCVKVKLEQSGSDIAGSIVYAKYIAGDKNQLGYNFDLGGNDYNIAVATNSDGYGVSELYVVPHTNNIFAGFLLTTPRVVCQERSLSKLIRVSATMGGGNITDRLAESDIHHIERNGETVTWQCQIFNGGHTKCVKVELQQSGADIVGRAVYAKYLLNKDERGYDFDTGGTDGTVVSKINDSGYGVLHLRLFFEDDFPRLISSGQNSFSGPLTVDGKVVELAGAGTLAGGYYNGVITNNGTLLLRTQSHQAFSNTITGTGSWLIDSPEIEQADQVYDEFLTDNFKKVFSNVVLYECTNVTAVLGGSFITGGTAPATAYHLKNDGLTLTTQLQAYNGGYTKCVKVEFKQVGADVEARILYAKYLPGQNACGFDFDTGGTGQGIATSSDTGGYGVATTVLNLRRYYPFVTFSGTNLCSGGMVIKQGVVNATGMTNYFALPSTGGIHVEPEGCLILNSNRLRAEGKNGVGNLNAIDVNGGLLFVAGYFNLGFARKVVLDGGVMQCMVLDDNDSGNYCNNLTLKNGALLKGYKLRIGYQSDARINVRGSIPSKIESGLSLVMLQNYKLTLDVDDVTGDMLPDLFITGEVRDFQSYSGMQIVKSGSGCVSLSGKHTGTGAIQLSDGALLLATNGAVNANNGLILDGGRLKVGEFDNQAGVLTLHADSVIELGSGKLALADSSAIAWESGKTVQLQGTLGKQSLRFGTSNTALTATQLAAITYNGRGMMLDAEGYLKELPQGTMILLW